MKKVILASLSAVALFGIAACSDSGTGSTDTTTTQSTNPPATEPAPVDLVESADASPEHRAISRDQLDRTRREIRRLSPKLRDALLLASSGTHSYDEIAAVLAIPVGTVKWRVAEARRLLHLRLPDLSSDRGES